MYLNDTSVQRHRATYVSSGWEWQFGTGVEIVTEIVALNRQLSL